MKIADVKAEFAKYMVISDPHVIDVIIATLIGNFILDRDPLWLMIVAPSSGGKSTFIAPVVGVKGCHFVDDLTEKTFLSGYKSKGKEVSLLKVIGSGVMCFSDFTSILSKNPLSRGEILGQLRLVYDGIFSKRTGIGEIVWRGKMGFLGACTTDIYHILEGSRAMGERFLYFTLVQPSDDDIVQKQREVTVSSKEITKIMEPLYHDYYMEVHAYIEKNGIPPLVLTADQERKVNEAAKFCVSAKATVHLDFKSQKPDALVSKPGVGRDRKMFQALLHSLLVIKCFESGDHESKVDDDMIRVVQRCAYSSVSRERRKILEILTSYDTSMTAYEIGATDDFGLPKESVEKYLYVLHAVGLVQRAKKGNTYSWKIADEDEKEFVRELSGVQRKSWEQRVVEEQVDTEVVPPPQYQGDDDRVPISVEDEAIRQAGLKGFDAA